MVNLPDVKIINDIISKVDKLPEVQCPVSNYFAPGIYVREMVIPADTIAIGHNHLTEHICTIVHGKIAFLRMDRSVHYYEAPATFIAGKGRKIVYAMTDTVVQNVHPNPDNLTDQQELEKLFIDKTVCLEDHTPRVEDRQDFESIEQDLVIDDFLPFSRPFQISLAVNRSNIHGKGLFALWPYHPSAYICPWMVEGKLTEAARWINHGKNPNAEVVKIMDGEMILTAKTEIKGCTGHGVGTELTIDYRGLI